ncbi:MAG: HAMP domain-containing histidine kinase [Erysipelotrichaceae bacterium]|nr:HAMP domain-containing histidine kinase [Erysipelotrichaceae bacterium]
MIKKLRYKFILIALVSVFTTLTLIMGSVNVLNYHKVTQNADNLLQILADNDGKFPIGQRPDEEGAPFDQNESFVGPAPDNYNEETPYESRYFSVTLVGQDVQTTNMEQIQAVDQQQATTYARQVYQQDRISGFISNYRYKIEKDGENTTIYFLDCTRTLDAFYSFLLISVLVSLIGFLIVCFLIVLASRRVTRPVAESYEKQKQFVTDAGHEIKTPLAIIQADLDVLDLEGINNEWLQDIRFQTKRLSSLTQDLIFLSKMEETNTFSMKEFSLSDTVQGIARSFESRARMEDKKYTYEIEPDLTIQGDQQRIEQLISLLLDNAFKYSYTQGEIRLDVKEKGKKKRIQVYNTTESISRKNLPYLFDRFYRIDSSRSRQTGGSGIGLSVAQAIVEAHKGTITATTEDEKSLLMEIVL